AAPPATMALGNDLIPASAAPASPANANGVIDCPSGPVKVSGFKITCDAILDGGTTLGSTQLAYTVANINQCAAKCAPVQRCVGFTYQAASASDHHRCVLFGP